MKNFLKTAPHQHKDPSVRLSFISELNAENEEAQETLAVLARDDDDEAVRVAAVAKLHDLNILRSLLGSEGDESSVVAEAAESRLLDMINAGEVSDIALRIILSSHASRLAVPIAAHTSASNQREYALAEITDESALVCVVQQSRFHDTRLAAAKRLSQHDALRSALSAVRSKDKVVAKQLQQRLDAEAAAEAALIAKRHAVNTTLNSVQSLLEGVWTPQHAGRLQAAKEKWASFDEADTQEHIEEFNTATEQAEKQLAVYLQSQQTAEQTDSEKKSAEATNGSTVALPGGTLNVETNQHKSESTNTEHLTVESTEADRPSTPPITDPEVLQLLASLKSATTTTLPVVIEQLSSSGLANNPAPNELNNNIVAYGSSVAVLFDPPYELNKARPGSLQNRIKRVESLVDVNPLLPGVDLSEHVFYQELVAHLAAMKERLGKAQQESTDRIKATHRQFAALTAIIKEGKWGPANSMLRRLQKKLSVMEPGERISLDEKLVRAEQQLAEMADWQDFAARPKLEVLCESMEALANKELHPEALAKQVRELQSAWKALGVSRASNDLWSRFKTAGDTAYEPCKQWFEVKQQERQTKIQAKTALCDALEADKHLLDGEVDWKAMLRRVNAAKREWSKNRVPDRKPDKQLEARFSAALKPFESALAEQYQINSEAKQTLVEKAKTLAEAEITQHSANQAKSLLSAWKLVGIMRRKEDQALWESFNGYLGTIFKHQYQVEKQKQRAGLEHVFRAKDIIKKLKLLSRSNDLNESEVQQLSTEFQGLAEFPDRDKKHLLRDFRQAIDACSRVQENASRRRVQAEHDEVQRLVGLCEQLEWAAESQEDASDNLVDDVMHAWEATEIRIAGELMAILTKRKDQALKHLANHTQPNYQKNENARRDLLVRMEVAAGIETPAEDKARRMQYQLQHLQEGMTSSGVNDKKQVLKKLEMEWLSLGPSSRQFSDALRSRFLKAYQR